MVLTEGAQLLDVHQDARVAGHADHRLFGEGALHAHGRRHAEAHGAQARRADPTARKGVQELCGPHLVLTDVRREEGLRGELLQHRDDLLGRDVAFGSGHHQGVVLLPLGDSLQPGFGTAAGVLFAGGRQQGFHGLLDVSDHSDVRQTGFAHLGRINVDVDDLGPRGKAIQAARDAVIKTGAHRDQQVAIGDGEVRVGGAVHPEHPHGQGMELIEGALAHQGGGHGQPEALRQGVDDRVGATADGAATDVEQWTPGLANQLKGGLDRAGVRGGRQLEARRNRGAGFHRDVVKFLDTHVLGHVDQDGTRPAAGGDQEGLRDDAGDVPRITHHPGVLHDRQGDAEDVGLLEGVRADRRPGHLPGDHHHGHRVHVGGGDARHQVGRAGAGGAKADTHLSGGPCIGVCGVGAALFMAHQDVLQPTPGLGLVQLVVDRKDGAARIAKDGLDAMAPQGIHQGVAATHPGGGGVFSGGGRLRNGRHGHGGGGLRIQIQSP